MSKKKGSGKDNNEIINNNAQVSKKTKKKAVSEDGNSAAKQKPEMTQSKLSKRIGIITLVGLVILLFYSPYFKGLYFNQEMSTTFFYSGILFGIFLIYKLLNKDFKILKSPLDAAAGALVLVYFLPILLGTAASAQYSWDKFLRQINYFFIYLIARDLIGNNKNITTILLNTILVSTIGVSVLGIDAGAGLILTNKINWFLENLPKWLGLGGGIGSLLTFKFFGGFSEGRIYSTLQYPNVLASYLGAVFLLTTGLLVVSNSIWKRLLYGSAGFIFFYTLLLTGSRGMFLIFPVMFILLLIVLKNKRLIIDAAVSLGVVTVVTVLVFYFLNYNELINTGKYLMVWLSILAGAVVSGMLSVLSNKIIDILNRISVKLYVVLAGLAAVAVVIFVGVGLGLEKPLVITHAPGEPDSDKTVFREISGIKPNNKYSLQFNLNAKSPAPDKTAYKLTVISMDSFAQMSQLAEVSGATESAVKSLEFNTKPDTKNIRIYMTNFTAGSSAEFSGFKLKDTGSGTESRIIAQYLYLPTDLVYKVRDISFTTHNVWERFIFFGDAFKIIADYPLGTGGGGWKALYHKYQSFGYPSNEVHSHPLQLWVETGIIGFMVFLVVIGFIIHHFYKTRMEIKDLNEETIKRIVLPSVVFMALISLYAHSAIDFDLSLSALSILVWVLTGLISGYYIMREKQRTAVGNGWNTFAAVAVIIMTITLAVAGFNSIAGRLVLSEKQKYGGKVPKEQIETQLSALISIQEKYLALQPLDEDNRLGNSSRRILGYMYYLNEYFKNVEEKNIQNVPVEKLQYYAKKKKENIDISVKNEPYSSASLYSASAYYIGKGDFDKAMNYADRIVESMKFVSLSYYQKASLYLAAGMKAVDSGQLDRGKAYLDKAKNIRAEIDEADRQAMKPIEISDELNKGIDEVVNEAAQLLGTL